MGNVVQPSWVPTAEQVEGSRIVAYARWLVGEGVASFADVTDFHEIQAWSAAHPQDFWSSVARYFDVAFHEEPTAVWESRKMPGTKWFPGARLNFAEHLLRTDSDRDAIVMIVEDGTTTTITHRELRRQVKALAGSLREMGVEQGDRVVAYLPNSIEGVVGFLATAWIGATWSQAGLDLAARSAADRLSQLDPKVLICGGGYFFKGLVHDRRNEARQLRSLLPSVEHTIAVSTAGLSLAGTADEVVEWESALTGADPVDVVPVEFDHPLWVLFTSGTTGKPKGIIHGHGGALLEQLASPGFHLDLGPEDVFFWYTSPNWMMWNAQVCGLLHGATIVLYDGNPVDPTADRLWRIAAQHGVTVFGTSPGYLKVSEQAGCVPGRDLDLSRMRIVAVTGSILPPAANRWVRENISPDVQVGSTSGGTDIVGIFVSSNPVLPVYDGEISGVALGVSLQVWNDSGQPLPAGAAGEMVITEPMPSMPIGFWNDPDDETYLETYFADFPGVWRHGDAITVTDRGTIVIHGRTDATLNRNGVRLGSAEIYDAVESLPDVADTLVVGVERPDGGYWMPMFVVVSDSSVDGEEIGRRIRDRLREQTSPRHVPDEVIVVPALPHTRTGKKLEVPIKKLLAGQQTGDVISAGAVDDTSALEWFVEFARQRAASVGEDDVEPTDDYRNWRVYSEQRMSRILSAALETFSENGYHGTTTRQLAERSGLSVPGIYHHYKSKQDILFDLMMVVVDELIERSRHALAEVEDDPRAQFDVLVEALLLFHMNRQKGAVLSANELRKLDPEYRVRYTARREEQQRMLDVVVSDGVASGVFHTPYPVDASRAIASLCLGVASWYHADGELPEDEFLKRYRAIAQSIVGGV
ncbi:acetoacetate--CoA ligase [Aeromicrobium ginsengisoli]|nr:acetoacetate--CoA ligase [Aeromicrobium ginsengisoli]